MMMIDANDNNEQGESNEEIHLNLIRVIMTQIKHILISIERGNNRFHSFIRSRFSTTKKKMCQ